MKGQPHQFASPPRVNPGSAIGALIEVDDWLAAIIPTYGIAFAALVDAQPGTSGRCAGTGDPGSGRTAFASSGPRASSSVVERTLGLDGDGDHPVLDDVARRDLATLYELPRLVWQAAAILAGPTVPAPVRQPVRELAWSRWVVRRILADDREGRRTRFNPRDVDQLHRHTHRLQGLVARWTTEARPPTKDERRIAAELSVDAADDGCEVHRRINEWRPRSDRYPSHKVCRACGDFTAANGFAPSLEVLEAWRDGRSVRSDMVDRARPSAAKKRRRRGK